MSTRIGVFASPTSPFLEDARVAVKNANGLQEQFRFELTTLADLGTSRGRTISVPTLERTLAKATPAVHGVILYDGRFHDGLSVHEKPPHRTYVSAKVSQSPTAPPFRLYLLYQLASASLALGGSLSRKVNEGMIHDPPIGCLWDWWVDSEERAAVMITARICPRCKERLRVHMERANERMAACLQMLDYIRRAMLGETPSVANRVFIAYGRAADWKELASLLEEWGLETEYFNREPAESSLVAARWLEMLNRSRFAFAVMTPDEVMKDGRRRVRQNVIHEIGLCHARLGLRNTAILIAKGTETFTNVSGIVHLEFESGKLKAQAGALRALLADRGLLE